MKPEAVKESNISKNMENNIKTDLNSLDIKSETNKIKDVYVKNNPNEINIAIVGDSGVGKSALFIKYMTNKFETFHIMSITTEIHRKVINYEDKQFTINVYVIPGLKQYQKDNTFLFKTIDYFIVVYDISSKKSFDNAVNIINNDMNKYICDNIYIVGNKCDMKNQSIDLSSVKKYCDDNKYNKFEVSAKNNTNVNVLMNNIIEKYYNALG
jgi:small GTP-binding protein